MGTSSDRKDVERHFNKVAKQFDDIYVTKKTTHRIFNRVFRRGIRKRYEVTKDFAEKHAKGKTVLDIGCGSGQVSLLFAMNGATVTGIDFAPQMIELAKDYSRELKVQKSTEFILGDFMDYKFTGKYDYTVVLGVTDYIRNPLPFVKKTISLTYDTALISFPKKYHFITPLRMLLFGLQNCPCYFYTRRQVEQLMEKSKVKNYKVIDHASLIMVIAKK